MSWAAGSQVAMRLPWAPVLQGAEGGKSCGVTVHGVPTLTQEPPGEGVSQGAHLQQQKDNPRAGTLGALGKVTGPQCSVHVTALRRSRQTAWPWGRSWPWRQSPARCKSLPLASRPPRHAHACTHVCARGCSGTSAPGSGCVLTSCSMFRTSWALWVPPRDDL